VEKQPELTRIGVRAIPNPFNPSTTIEFIVPVRGRVRVTGFNANGRVVQELVDEVCDAGEYRIQYHARTAGGVYFARVEVAGHSATMKVVLLK
jgi:hypothetical protein